MIHADRRFSSAVEAAVESLEKRTDAEVVVVASERSEAYRDVAIGAGAIAAFAVFVALLFLPWPVPPLFAIADVVTVFLLVTWGVSGSPLCARIAGANRREEAVRRAAAAEFHLEAVHGTPRRTGLLVFVSGWERKVELIPDVGLEARIPRALWAKALDAFSGSDLDGFLAGLEATGELLAEHVPHTEGQRVDLANAPRIRA